jgi:phage terminase small subunit
MWVLAEKRLRNTYECGGGIDVNLTAKQQLFVKEYLVDLNATQAAIRAGYSEATAKEMGYENLTKPHIKEAIDKVLNKRSEKLEISAEYVLRGLKDIADNNKEKTQNRIKAFELMGKHIKMFTDKVEQQVIMDNTVTVVFDEGMDDEE